MNNINTNSILKKITAIAGVFIFSSTMVFAHLPEEKSGIPVTQKPLEIENVGVEEKLGAQLNPHLQFTDHNGKLVTLGDYFNKDHRPIILSLVYYNCPGLCNFHLNAMIDVMRPMDWSIGNQFKYLTVSFDASEKFETAQKKRESYLKQYNRTGAEKDWWFLVGSTESVKEITDEVGFKYKWIEKNKEWSHASVAIILTPEGKVSRYLPGLTVDSQTLKMALNEASNGRIGTLMDKILMYCFHYDPKNNKYALYAVNIMKLGGLLAVSIIGMILFLAYRRENRKEKQAVVRS